MKLALENQKIVKSNYAVTANRLLRRRTQETYLSLKATNACKNLQGNVSKTPLQYSLYKFILYTTPVFINREYLLTRNQTGIFRAKICKTTQSKPIFN